MRRAGIIAALLAGLLSSGGPASAEVTLSGGGGAGWGSANADSTRNVERWITGANRFCASYAPRWRVDCLRDQYRQVVPRLPRTGPYAVVATALNAAADELEIIALREADPDRAPARLSEQGGAGRQSAGAVRATAPARQNAANRAASAVIDQLATQLL